ncbi:hypothetical protein CYMTET_4666 [Cymbomonas tetramitiformis]|uniref:Uncharacterized protein n=1 Tax=Cymbomonas tetramitiformis TaxID=36881 RepID=A0AAE0LJU9_9CHLO|nr:hypothetical protein CYMTET_4666 [Cymbomonas tetramitiformis]
MTQFPARKVAADLEILRAFETRARASNAKCGENVKVDDRRVEVETITRVEVGEAIGGYYFAARYGAAIESANNGGATPKRKRKELNYTEEKEIKPSPQDAIHPTAYTLLKQLIDRWTFRRTGGLPELCATAMLLNPDNGGSFTRTALPGGIKDQKELIMSRWSSTKSCMIVLRGTGTKFTDEE